MELFLHYLTAALFALIGLGCVFLVLLSLPGAWIMLGLAVLIELLDVLYLPEGATQTFNWWVLIAAAALAALGELFEFLAGALGARSAGSTKRGMIGAVVGGITGAIIGAPFGLIIGAFIGGALGTFVGAIIGEMTAPDMKVQHTLKPAAGATVGRILGTLSKLPIAFLIWLILTISAFAR